MLSMLRKLFTGEMGVVSSLVMIVILANIGVNIWQRGTIRDLRDWQTGVLEELARAVDQRDGKGRLLPVRAQDARAHIAHLGRFRIDVRTAQDQARADDAEHALASERAAATINRKAADDHLSQLADIRAEADRLRAALAAYPAADAGRLRPDGPAGNGHGGGGGPSMPGLAPARSGADAAPGAQGLPASACTPMSIDERQLATEQATQLDNLIGAIEALAQEDRKRGGDRD